MPFNSLDYLQFFLAVVWLHFVLAHRWRWMLLLLASYVFYMWWNPKYVLLIWASTAVDYIVGLRLSATAEPGRRRAWLAFSLVANLGLLFSFKYWGFFWQTFAELGAALGRPFEAPALEVLLPVGISFYTFQSVGYSIDVYRGRIPAERRLGRFALYVAFFPQLVAGPIERAARLLPQIDREKSLDWERISAGVQLMLWGLFKKMVIADRLAIHVDAVWAAPDSQSPATLLVAAYAFTLQIYCDFSGYTDIAIGSAKVLGFDLMENFRRPFFAASTREFWQRWHISLSTWLRDYLYISLGGSRRGLSRTYANLLTTMLLGGLWHGASWTFVLWGALHGSFLVLGRLTAGTRDRAWRAIGLPPGLRRAGGVLLTFHLVVLAFVCFRAPSLTALVIYAKGLAAGVRGLGTPSIDPIVAGPALFGLTLLFAVQICQERWGSVRELVRALPRPIRWTGWYTLGFATVVLGVTKANQFIYFRF